MGSISGKWNQGSGVIPAPFANGGWSPLPSNEFSRGGIPWPSQPPPEYNQAPGSAPPTYDAQPRGDWHAMPQPPGPAQPAPQDQAGAPGPPQGWGQMQAPPWAMQPFAKPPAWGQPGGGGGIRSGGGASLGALGGPFLGGGGWLTPFGGFQAPAGAQRAGPWNPFQGAMSGMIRG
jgi:hypothetical protein